MIARTIATAIAWWRSSAASRTPGSSPPTPTSRSSASTPAEDAPRLAAELARGILVKDASGLPRLTGCLRIGVGTTAELNLLEAALAELMPETRPAT